jgi:hypothetical protein
MTMLQNILPKETQMKAQKPKVCHFSFNYRALFCRHGIE